MKHSPGICIAAAVLSGCIQTPIAVEPPATSAEPVLCVNRSQCDVYWQRAQAWVANNSVYRLQTVTDTVLETAGPLAARTSLAYRITRVPDNQDGARIYVMAACGSAMACNPAPSDAVIAFKRFVVN
ncbi:MAG TPA: hypothetical protein VFZ14_13030 [Burkholderiales bacterium]|jgi:hypothetical protein|nr:hypothetical protein [Burkholderiales bacterium]